MTVCPAHVAGVSQIAVCMPPNERGGYNREMLATCHELGVSEVYRLGGAQAIASMAYGIEGLKPVDMIVGPGNQYVALAKKNVFGQVAIDCIAGAERNRRTSPTTQRTRITSHSTSSRRRSTSPGVAVRW